jgi:hypothetical protein
MAPDVLRNTNVKKDSSVKSRCKFSDANAISGIAREAVGVQLKLRRLSISRLRTNLIVIFSSHSVICEIMMRILLNVSGAKYVTSCWEILLYSIYLSLLVV